MKIVTINVPESYVDSMEKLVGDDGLFPSRSELIRVAVRDFLLKELRLAKKIFESQYNEKENEFDEEKYVRVPLKDSVNSNEPVKEFKTYKIIKRLDY